MQLRQTNAAKRAPVWTRLYRDILKNPAVYVMLIPVLAYYILFCYKPMYGVIIAFKDYSPRRGILGSTWVGMKYFVQFFSGPYFGRTLRNTILINLYNILWGFPAPILLALLLNELKDGFFKKTVQTITYIPHFISAVVIAGIIKSLLAYRGVLTDVLVFFGMERVNLLIQPNLFRTIYVVSDIWQGVGWGTIIYLAAISGVDKELYESARVDGASRLRQAISITIPSITPTIVILLILRIGSMMSLGHEKIILLYSPNTYETADVISSYVYRSGIINGTFSYSAAVGLFNSLVNLFLVVLANKVSGTLSETSLW